MLRLLYSAAFLWLLCNADEKNIKHHKLLLVSIDGLRWDYPNRAELEAFKYLKENGVKAEYLRNIFPTLTSPSHFSIATGLYAESHGVVHNAYYDLEKNVGLIDSVDYYLSTLSINEWWDNGAQPIWITAVNHGLKSGGYKFPGSYATINGVNATMKVIDTAHSTGRSEDEWKQQIIDVMEWFTVHDLDIIAMYFEQPDFDEHFYGPDHELIFKTSLPMVSRSIMYLIEQVEKYGLTDDLNIIIVSDHGFESVDTSVGEDEAISLAQYVDQSYIKFMYNFGPMGLIEPTPGNAKYVAEQLRKGNPHMTVYLKENIPERFHYKNNPRIPSILVLADPGHAVYDGCHLSDRNVGFLLIQKLRKLKRLELNWNYDKFENFPKFHKYKGHHGYDNMLENMRAIYYSIGPSFKKGYEIEGFDSVHIYPLMCHLLGLDPNPNNGSLDVLMETLVENTTKNYYSNLPALVFILVVTLMCFNALRRKF